MCYNRGSQEENSMKVNWKMLGLGIAIGLVICGLWATTLNECKGSSAEVALKCVDR